MNNGVSLSTLASGSNGYDPNYEAILYWDTPTNLSASDTATILNNYYLNNRGVVLASYADEQTY